MTSDSFFLVSWKSIDPFLWSLLMNKTKKEVQKILILFRMFLFVNFWPRLVLKWRDDNTISFIVLFGKFRNEREVKITIYSDLKYFFLWPFKLVNFLLFRRFQIQYSFCVECFLGLAFWWHKSNGFSWWFSWLILDCLRKLELKELLRKSILEGKKPKTVWFSFKCEL